MRVVILWMFSIDNLQRDSAELGLLQGTIGKATQRLRRTGKYRLRVLGGTSLIDPRLTEIPATAYETGLAEAVVVNTAVAYGGRREIVAAVREYLHERTMAGHGLARVEREITFEDIEAHLYIKGQPGSDLVIRASGEQRLSGFLLWQSVNSGFYFCKTCWPNFRHIGFLQALRDYSSRERRNGR